MCIRDSLVTSALIGQLLVRVQNRASEARRQQLQAELLYEISRAAMSTSNVVDVYEVALRRLCETLGLGWSKLAIRVDERLDDVPTYGTPPETADAQHLRRRVIEDSRVYTY